MRLKIVAKNQKEWYNNLHKPHPSKILKTYQVNEILRVLKEGGII